MTSLPASTGKKLGLVIDLDICVGCHACVTSCKEWNTGGYSAPLTDHDPYGGDPHGAWLNRVHSYEVGEGDESRTVHFPRSCLHCEEPDCVTVCPTGASYKRAEDGIVLVNPDTCIGCKLCSWACPYGAREYDHDDGVMKKCTLCVDRIYNETMAEEDRVPACVRACPTGARAYGDLGDPTSAVSQSVAARDGFDLLETFGYKPVNKYLPPIGSLWRGPRRRPNPRQRLRPRTGPPSKTCSPGSIAPCPGRGPDMHPAYSVILFTTASGAGYGLLFWLSLAQVAGTLPESRWFAFIVIAVALVLITAGLLASSLHLGHPERAIGAFSQWRSSWLSREGVAAVVTYVPAGLLAVLWLFGIDSGFNSLLAVLSAAGAVITVYCTGMIYASLRTIRQWNMQLVPLVYLALAAATGMLLFAFLLALFAGQSGWAVLLILVSLAAGAALKLLYWRRIDADAGQYTAEMATGLGAWGTVRPLEPPHSRPNFVMREMGYTVARKHAQTLRIGALVALFAMPAVLVLAALLTGWFAVLCCLAVAAATVGVIIERWLFFAEAEHVSQLYYGARRA